MTVIKWLWNQLKSIELGVLSKCVKLLLSKINFIQIKFNSFFKQGTIYSGKLEAVGKYWKF